MLVGWSVVDAVSAMFSLVSSRVGDLMSSPSFIFRSASFLHTPAAAAAAELDIGCETVWCSPCAPCHRTAGYLASSTFVRRKKQEARKMLR